HAADGDETGGSARRARLAGGLAVTGIIVTIDGPSGSGKSTISKRLAASRGLAYLHTGPMYRAATWWYRHEQIDLTDQDAVATAAWLRAAFWPSWTPSPCTGPRPCGAGPSRST